MKIININGLTLHLDIDDNVDVTPSLVRNIIRIINEGLSKEFVNSQPSIMIDGTLVEELNVYLSVLKMVFAYKKLLFVELYNR